MPPLRIATCRPLPEPDADEALLLDALRHAGIDARMAAWHDPCAWDEPVPTVVRSTWNYYRDLPSFVAWVERVGRVAPLWNPPELIGWNVHKSYLARLAGKQIPVVPTVLVARGSETSIEKSASTLVCRDIIVKPAVSAGSYRTARFDLDDPDQRDAADAWLHDLVRDRDAMVQSYLREVETRGERSLIWIDGALTHAMRKSPRFAGGDEHVTGPFPIDDDERALALAVLAPFVDRLLYARVDTIRDAGGTTRVMEVELIEPSLFLGACPAALERLVEGIARRLHELGS